MPTPNFPPESSRVRTGSVDPVDTGAWVACARAIADDLGLKTLRRRVDVQWNPRLRTSAGRALWGKGAARIELNPRLKSLPEGQRDAEIRRTFLHELAHLVAYARAGRRRIQPHGVEWRQACADVGIPGESACHTLRLAPSRRQQPKFGYQCPQCFDVLRRVRRIKGPAACMACCRTFAKGQFDRRFKLVEFRVAGAGEETE